MSEKIAFGDFFQIKKAAADKAAARFPANRV